MNTIACPACSGNVSNRAFDCPRCGHPLRKPRRGFFGGLIKWTFIGFNVLMIVWLGAYWSEMAEMSEGLSEAEAAGAAIGGTMGTGLILVTWALGAVILGLLTLLTRPIK